MPLDGREDWHANVLRQDRAERIADAWAVIGLVILYAALAYVLWPLW